MYRKKISLIIHFQNIVRVTARNFSTTKTLRADPLGGPLAMAMATATGTTIFSMPVIVGLGSIIIAAYLIPRTYFYPTTEPVDFPELPEALQDPANYPLAFVLINQYLTNILQSIHTLENLVSNMDPAILREYLEKIEVVIRLHRYGSFHLSNTASCVWQTLGFSEETETIYELKGVWAEVDDKLIDVYRIIENLLGIDILDTKIPNRV